MATANLDIVTRFRNESSAAVGQLGSDLDRLNAKATAVGRGFSGLQSLANAAMVGIAGGVTALVAGFGAAAGAGLRFNSSMEQVEAQLFAFLKDGEKVASTLDMIRDRASRTPFEFEEMANAAAGLIPAAKQSGQELEKLISIAEVLAASNPAEGLEGAAFSLREALSGDFTSIIERFNLPRQRLNELKEEGVPALEAVSTAMRELGLDADLVTNLAGTAVGRWSTIKDTLVGIAASLTQPIFTAVSAGMGDLITKLDAAKPIIDGVVAGISGFVENLVAGQPFIQSLQGAVIDVAEALGLGRTRALEIALELTNLITAVQNGWQVFTDFLQPLTDFVTQFVSWKDVLIVIGGIVASVVIPALISLAAAVAPVILVFGGLVLAVATLRTAWEENFAGIQELVAGVWEGLQVAFDGVKQLLEGDLTGAMETFRLAWETGWTAVVAFVGNLWEMMEPYLAQAWESVVAWFGEQPWETMGQVVIDKIAGGLAGFGETIRGKLQEWNQVFLNWAHADSWAQIGHDLVKLIEEGAGGSFKEFETSIFQNGMALVGKLLDGLATFSTRVLETLTGWTTSLTGWVSGYDWSQLGYNVTTAVITGLKGFVALVAGTGGVLETWRQGFVKWASDVENWKALGKAVVDGIIAGWKFTESVKGAIADFFNGVIRAVKDALGIASPSKVMMEIGKDTIQGFLDGAKSLASKAVEIGMGIVDGVKRGIDGAVGGLVEKAKAMAQAAIDAAKDLLGINSPSTVFAAFGGYIGQGLAVGIQQMIPVVMTAGQGLATAVASGFGGGNGLGGFTGQLGTFVEQIGQLADRFGDELIDRVKRLAEAGKAVTELVVPFMESITAISNFEGGINPTKLLGWKANVETIFNAVAEMAYYFDTLLGNTRLIDQVSRFTDAAIKITDLISKSLVAIGELAKFEATTDIRGKVQLLATQLREIVRSMADVAVLFSVDLLNHLEQFAKSVTPVLSLTKTAVDGLTALSEFAGEPVPVSKMKAFASQIELLVMTMAGIAVVFSIEVLDALKTFAERAKVALDIVKPGVEALGAISEFVGLANARQKIGLFVSQLYLLVQELAVAFGMITWGEVLTAAALLPEQIGKLLSIIKPGLDALAAINEVTAVEQLQQKVAIFRSQLLAVARALAESFSKAGMFNDFDAALEGAAELPAKINKLLVVVGPGLKALQDIDQITAVSDLVGKINLFRSQILAVARALAESFSRAGVFNGFDAALEGAQLLPEKINKLLTAVKPGIDALAAINEFVGVSQLEEKIELFMHQLVRAVAFMARELVTGLGGLEESLASAGVLSGLAKDVLETVKRGVDSLAALNEFVGVTQLEEKIELFMHQLVRSVLFMTRELNSGLLGLEEALASAGNLSGLAKDVLETVKRGVDSLLALNEFVGVANLEATLALFGQQLVQTVVGLTTGLNEGLAGMEEALTSAGSLSGLAKDVLETVKRGVDSLLALAEFSGVNNLSSTLDVFVAQLVYTVQRLTAGLNAGLAGMEESLTSAGILSGLAKDVLESVKRGVDSLTALGEFEGVENLGATLSLFSSQFTSAVQSVTGTLNNIAQTIGQEALTAAAGVAGTIKGIADSVLASIRTINNLAESEEPQSLQGIMNQLVAAVTIQIPSMETVGFNFGAAFVTGILNGLDLPTMTQTFYDAGLVTGQSFGYGIADGIYASIPTAVDAAMELAANVQAILGGLYSGGGGGVPSLPPIGAGGGSGGNGGNSIVIYGLTVQGVQNPADLVAQLEAYAG